MISRADPLRARLPADHTRCRGWLHTRCALVTCVRRHLCLRCVTFNEEAADGAPSQHQDIPSADYLCAPGYDAFLSLMKD